MLSQKDRSASGSTVAGATSGAMCSEKEITGSMEMGYWVLSRDKQMMSIGGGKIIYEKIV